MPQKIRVREKYQNTMRILGLWAIFFLFPVYQMVWKMLFFFLMILFVKESKSAG